MQNYDRGFARFFYATWPGRLGKLSDVVRKPVVVPKSFHDIFAKALVIEESNVDRGM
jgi:hypothetical protein